MRASASVAVRQVGKTRPSVVGFAVVVGVAGSAQMDRAAVVLVVAVRVGTVVALVASVGEVSVAAFGSGRVGAVAVLPVGVALGIKGCLV